MRVSLRRVEVTRYVTPFREGGSLPALVEADDDGMYVLKFRGAGQGRKALVAEVITGELARSAGLPVPELVVAELDPVLARSEPDPEIQDLIRASAGLNLGMDYLPGSFGFDPLASPITESLAARILWFDALTTNVDRTPHNANLLLWHGEVWCIDHGASLYFHHSWAGWREKAKNPFPAAKTHVLLPFVTPDGLEEAGRHLRGELDDKTLWRAVSLVPDEWLAGEAGFDGAEGVRAAYLEYFRLRLEGRETWGSALRQTVRESGRG
ncbi:HipA family kinase [Rubrobacter indicoceani]|uniref:HipA family kinase n=1 Tax=Rubrobacter indicoceani TaxID=2051957 RepID=UPI000E5A8D55|nr:HipA family kinase [Rubrobacter indicoceani]